MNQNLQPSLSQNIKIQDNDTHSHLLTPNNQGTEVNRSRTWKQSELYLVAAFLYYNFDKFSSESSKKQFKIFKYMSYFIGSRNINQCRSYLNKLLKSFGSIQKVNKYFKDSLPLYCNLVTSLRLRNQHTFRQSTFMQSSNYTHHINQIIDKIMVVRESDEKQRIHQVQLHTKYCRVIIPQVHKQEWETTNFDRSFQNLLYYESSQALQWLLGIKFFQWAKNSYYCPYVANSAI